MADQFPKIDVDVSRVVARFGGLPNVLRARLRAELPAVTQRLADRVRRKLQPGALGTSPQTGHPLFRTSDRLLPSVTVKLIEDVNIITGRVYLDPNIFPAVAGLSLEGGARPHPITGNPTLSFLWDNPAKGIYKRMVIGAVSHPGFPGAFFLRDSLRESRDEIRQALTRAAADAVKGQ